MDIQVGAEAVPPFVPLYFGERQEVGSRSLEWSRIPGILLSCEE